jgi:cell division protein FtsQ
MDGGGRYLQPMTAYPAGIAVARAASGNRGGASSQFKNPPRIKKLFGASRGVRRRSAGVPIEQRLPRFLGSGLAVGFFSVVIGFGLWQGGHIDGFIRDYGEPHHALARAVGLGLEQVTISGISQMGENEVLAAAGINSKLSLAFLDVNGLRERLERVPMVKSATVRKLYPNELVITLT